ncbi:class I tRNA ligase family protein, partial [Candidatus Peregrinibacteria bacterium]|nr:class I tRNA ligase family protein [Candidatus Peregrinibacteria bacterium]
MSKYYITTAIAYVNAAPHIGFALELIQADAMARYHRLRGDDTYFLTGTDEHGVKIYETAQKAGMSTQAFVDKNAGMYKALEGLLNLSNDDFVRTSSSAHKEGVKKIWKAMFEKGDIYKGVYKGNYCVGCEAFIPDKDLTEEGFCSIHKKKPDMLEEENYFFRLSKYSYKIKKAIKSDKLLVRPESRKNEMLNIIGDEGLNDVSFSRPKEVLPWGVDVPDDASQVMYVWCDALSNYITALGYADDGKLF